MRVVSRGLRLLRLHGRRLRPLAKFGVNVSHYLVVGCHAVALLPPVRRRGSATTQGKALKLLHHSVGCWRRSLLLLLLLLLVHSLLLLLRRRQHVIGKLLLLNLLLLLLLDLLLLNLLLLDELTLMLLELNAKSVLVTLGKRLLMLLLMLLLLLLLLLLNWHLRLHIVDLTLLDLLL